MTKTPGDHGSASREFAWFGAVTATIYVIWIAMTHTSRFDVHPDLLSWGAAFDITVTVPFVYWLLVVRRGRARGRSVLAVIALSVVGAKLLLPSGHTAFLQMARFATLPIELAILILAIHRVRVARRMCPVREADVLTQLQSTLKAIVGNGAAGRALGYEASTFYYAFADRPSAMRDAEPLREVQFAAAPPFATAVFMALLGIIAIETAVLHLLVAMRSSTVAWILTGLSVYAIIWLVAFQRSFSQRFSEIGPAALILRIGLRCDATVPWTNVASVRLVTWRNTPPIRPDYLNAAKPGEPNILIAFHDLVRTEGPYGISRMVTQVGVHLERPETFISHVAARASWPS